MNKSVRMDIEWNPLKTKFNPKLNFKYKKIQTKRISKLRKLQNYGRAILIDLETLGFASFKYIPPIREMACIMIDQSIEDESTGFYFKKTKNSIENLYKLIVENDITCLIAHNGIFFDFPIILAYFSHYGLLDEKIKNLKFIDTLQTIKRSNKDIKEFSNIAIYRAMVGDLDKNIKLHRANVDVALTYLWFKKLIPPYLYYNFEEILKYAERHF